MTARLVFLGILIFLLYTLIKKVFGRPTLGRSREFDKNGNPAGVVDEMVKCSACGVYLPQREAIHRTVNGNALHFCNKTCATQYKTERKGAK